MAVVLALHAVGRTVVDRKRAAATRNVVVAIAEVGLSIAGVAVTGWWGSPFVFTLLPGVVAAGFSEGFVLSFPLAVVAAAVVTVGSVPTTSAQIQLSTEGVLEVLLVSGVSSYGRHLFGQAEQRTVTALSRLNQLAQANNLLLQLNAVAQALPASLDLKGAVNSTVEQVQSLLHPDAVALFLWDASLQIWSTAAAVGARVAATLDEASLPVPARRVSRASGLLPRALLVNLGDDGPGLTPAARTGVYAPLVSRGTLIGVLLAESKAADGLTGDDLELVDGIAEQAALAIDNAIWFRRLRTLGAEEERGRIARDLHDRVAQSLAYLAFELDRLVNLSEEDKMTNQLQALRQDVRAVVTEVRDTLYDLRTDVSDEHDLTATIEDFLDRVRGRTNLAVSFEHRALRRLPVPLERELWRIAQEAIVNAERHARARSLLVRWTVTADHAEVAVSDDGVGLLAGTPGRLDSYGLVGMRERADAIGATLEIISGRQQGTTIRCRVEVA